MKVSILGSGVYAKALSSVILSSNCELVMWTEKKDFKEVLAKDNTKLTNSFEEAADAEVIFVLTGSPFVKTVLEGVAPYVSPATLIVLGSKGILEDGTLMTEISTSILPNNPYAVISGPTFAVDIASSKPVGFTIATEHKEEFQKIEKCLKTVYLEYYEDTLAIEMCGSLKNAYAIGSGIISGFNYGHSTSCLYITKALKEMGTIFQEFGSSENAINTLAGVGDLVLTCTSENSRNFTFGNVVALGTEEQKRDYLKSTTVEGYENLKAYVSLFERKNIKVPILTCVSHIVEGSAEPQKLISILLEK